MPDACAGSSEGIASATANAARRKKRIVKELLGDGKGLQSYSTLTRGASYRRSSAFDGVITSPARCGSCACRDRVGGMFWKGRLPRGRDTIHAIHMSSGGSPTHNATSSDVV